MTSSGPELFLDFDGVICNSLDECYVSSFLAHHGGNIPDSTEIRSRALFDTYRPFIRSGGDYVAIQHLVDHGVVITDQIGFDRAAAEIGDSRAMRSSMYRARGRLLADAPDYWLSLNRLYPEIRGSLQALSSRHWILTTKEPSYVERILDHNGIRWPVDRIICSGSERKLDIIAASVSTRALLIDDQIAHLRPNPYGTIDVLLASWGFVRPEWLLQSDVPILERADLDDALRPFF